MGYELIKINCKIKGNVNVIVSVERTIRVKRNISDVLHELFLDHKEMFFLSMLFIDTSFAKVI